MKNRMVPTMTAYSFKQERKLQRLTQTEVARRAGLTQGVISKFENEVTVPNYLIVFKIAVALGYEIVFKKRRIKHEKKWVFLEGF